MHPDLEHAIEELAAVRDLAQEKFSALTEAQASWRPEPGRWSVVECLEHCNLVDRTYLENAKQSVGKALAKGKTSDGPFRYGWIGRKFLSILEAPAVQGRGVKAPGKFLPPHQLEHSKVLADFAQVHDDLIAVAKDAEGLDLQRVKVASPITSLLRFNLGLVFNILTAHDRRHLTQAERVLSAKGLPGS